MQHETPSPSSNHKDSSTPESVATDTTNATDTNFHDSPPFLISTNPPHFIPSNPIASKENSLCNNPPAAGHFHSKHPRSWTASEVGEWLRSKNISDTIIEIFVNEEVTGLSLINSTDEDLSALLVGSGGRIGQRMHIRSLINELKSDWEGHESAGAAGSQRGGVPGVLAGRVMEVGKGAPSTLDIYPPSYSP
jgi:hypothetical protein